MVPRKVGSAWEVISPAKLNLYLEILGRQASGYHELETLIVTIRLADTLHWTSSGPESATVDSAQNSYDSHSQQGTFENLHLRVINRIGNSSATCFRTKKIKPSSHEVPADENNLVIQAARLIASHAGHEPYGTFTLYKRIPTCAGLGGGSSNAAATLLLANTAWSLGFSSTQLLDLAAEIGSDVPFFVATKLAGAAAICRGRGERVETIGSLGRLHFVLVKPHQGIVTKKLFEQVDLNAIDQERLEPSPLPQLLTALRRSDLFTASHLISNRLEPVALAQHAWLRHLQNALDHYTCRGHWMTGSGSTYVCLMQTAKQAQHLAGALRARRLGEVFTTMSC